MDKEILKLRDKIENIFKEIATTNPNLSKYFYKYDDDGQYPDLDLKAIEDEILKQIDDLIRSRFKDLIENSDDK